MARTPDAGEWASFTDPDEDRTWLVDVGFLASPWHCIYGAGCQGVLTAPAPEQAEGCCSYGAHFTGAQDEERVRRAAATLSDAQWQFRGRAAARGAFAGRGGARTTRLVESACIFLNRPGFPGGPGCALHRGALEGGVAPMAYKPDVCWQLPLRREDFTDARGHVTSVLGSWERRHWGPGGEEFAWWCTEDPAAFSGAAPVWRALAPELRAMTSPALYDAIAAYLDERAAVLLPHPTLRRHAAQSGEESSRSCSSSSSSSAS